MPYKLVKSTEFPKIDMSKIIFMGSLFLVLFYLLYDFKDRKTVKYINSNQNQKLQN